VTETSFGYSGITKEQLYSTASYKAKDLSGIAFMGNDLTGWNLAEQNLTGAHFYSTTLTGANLASANLTGADFNAVTLDHANLSNADFSNANLAGVDFSSATLTGANLSGANLASAYFGSATLDGVDLTDAVVTGASFSGSSITMEQLYSTAGFKAKDLTRIGLSYNDLTGWNLAGQNLTGARFDAATLTDADLSSANLTSSSFSGATLTGADFTDAVVTSADLSNSTFTKEQLYLTANYKDKDLAYVIFRDDDLKGCYLSGQNLTHANFIRATLSGADLSNANLTGAMFNSATLDGADLTDVLISGANFQIYMGGSGITKEQLYSTASYKAKDLRGIGLSRHYLPGCDLAGQNLTGAYFGNASLTNANLGNANLKGANFYNATLTGADLTDAVVAFANFGKDSSSSPGGLTYAQLFSTASYKAKDLRGIVLSYGNLTGWNLAGQNLTGADLSHANLDNADLYNANLTRATLQYATFTGANVSSANLAGADLSYANSSNANLYNTNLMGAHCAYTTFTGTNISSANLQWAMLGGASCQYATFTGANVRSANLSNADFRNTNLTGASLFGAILTGVDLTDAVVTHADFSKYSNPGTGITKEQLYSTASYKAKDLAGIGLSYNFLNGCDLTGQDLTEANLSGAILTGANFSGANLADADLRRAIDASLLGATLHNTIGPDGHILGLALGNSDETLVIRNIHYSAYVTQDWTYAGHLVVYDNFNMQSHALTVDSGGTLAVGRNFNVSGSTFKASSLNLTSATLEVINGTTTTQNAGTAFSVGNLTIEGIYHMMGGTLNVGSLSDNTTGSLYVPLGGVFSVTDAPAEIYISKDMTVEGTYAAIAGTEIHMTGATLHIGSTAGGTGLANTAFYFEGGEGVVDTISFAGGALNLGGLFIQPGSHVVFDFAGEGCPIIHIHDLDLGCDSTLDLGGLRVTYDTFTNDGGTYGNGTLILHSVPEPDTLMIIAPALLGLLGTALRKIRRP
jgi:uncharacterized protein YjbI with pentapeptide repeats